MNELKRSYLYCVYKTIDEAVKDLVQVDLLNSWYIYSIHVQSDQSKPISRPKFQNVLMFWQNIIFGIKHHVKVQCLPTVYTKYENVPVKPMEGVEFLM